MGKELSTWDQAILEAWRNDPQKVLEGVKQGKIPLRVISLNQPFCTLMEYGKIETRNRPTNVRGMVMLASCKEPYSDHRVMSIAGRDQYARIIGVKGLATDIGKFRQTGKALSIGFLSYSRKMKLEDEDKCFVEYYPDLYCWEFDTVRSIEPFDYKGKQGWTLLDIVNTEHVEIINKIKILSA
jgi:hypothetical protein